jgi:hypothetical protein
MATETPDQERSRPPYDPSQEWVDLVTGEVEGLRFKLQLRADRMELRWSFRDLAELADWTHYPSSMETAVERAAERHLASTAPITEPA